MPKYRERYLREQGRFSVEDAQAAEAAAPVETVSGLKPHLAGELVVQFSPGAAAAVKAAALSSVGGRIAEHLRMDADGAVRITIPAGLDVARAIEILSKIPGVQFAEPNYIVSVDAVSNDGAYTGGQLWGMYGDGTSPANQYGSQAGEAWAAGHTGSTKVVTGVIDSGIDYTHPDLYLNVWLNQGEIAPALKAALIDTDGDNLITFRDLNDARNAGSVSDHNANGRIDGGDLLPIRAGKTAPTVTATAMSTI